MKFVVEPPAMNTRRIVEDVSKVMTWVSSPTREETLVPCEQLMSTGTTPTPHACNNLPFCSALTIEPQPHYGCSHTKAQRNYTSSANSMASVLRVFHFTQSVLVSSNLSQTALNSIPTSLRDFFQRVHALPRSRSSQGADLIGWVPSFRSAAIEAGHAMTPWEVCGKCLKLVIYSRVLDSMLCELTA